MIRPSAPAVRTLKADCAARGLAYERLRDALIGTHPGI